MGNKNWWVAQQKLNGAKKRLLKLYPSLPERTGIYILTRVDENGFKYAYVGQTKAKGGILKRLAEHLLGYQHIDRSLKAHKLQGEKDVEYGWLIDWVECLDEELNKLEQDYIKTYANMGYQMRNKTIGSQGKGKTGLGEQKPSKGYYDGLKQGYKNCLKDIKEYFEKYLNYDFKRPQCYKKNGELKEIYLKKLLEFKKLLEEKTDDETM